MEETARIAAGPVCHCGFSTRFLSFFEPLPPKATTQHNRATLHDPLIYFVLYQNFAILRGTKLKNVLLGPSDPRHSRPFSLAGAQADRPARITPPRHFVVAEHIADLELSPVEMYCTVARCDKPFLR